jgi:L,D-transpeptidase catalytic domain
MDSLIACNLGRLVKEMNWLIKPITGVLLFSVAISAQAKVAITVDKDAQRMTVEVDGVARYKWPVSTGLPSHETPNGSFRAFRMEEDHYSKEFDDAPMPHSIFFTKAGHAIHGTDSVSRLGTPASHGCVRLSRDNASKLYALVQSDGVFNTTVNLAGSSEVALARNPGARTKGAVASRRVPQGPREAIGYQQLDNSGGNFVSPRYYINRGYAQQDVPQDYAPQRNYQPRGFFGN